MTTMTKLSMPQISINGSSKQRLVEQQLTLASRLNYVLKDMVEASPHGRDYQHRPEEYPAARDAWGQRILMIDELIKEIEAHALAIHDLP